MKYKHIYDSYFYMNPCTGSTSLGSEWKEEFIDYYESQDLDLEDAWIEWGGDSLIMVIKDASGEWIEH